MHGYKLVIAYRLCFLGIRVSSFVFTYLIEIVSHSLCLNLFSFWKLICNFVFRVSNQFKYMFENCFV